ncbi:PKD domain-containing protein [Chitinophaga skermanii]|nr:PKD domain-containing protein [Chitinophaga skermanii]
MNSWGGTMGAWLHLPDDYNTTSERYPLLIFIHGIGEQGTNLDVVLNQGLPRAIARGAKMNFTVNGKTFKFITVCPQAPNGWFNESMVDAVLEDMKKRYRVDDARIYLTGISAGGYGVWNYVASGTTYSDKIAAIVPVSAAGIDNSKLGGLCNLATSNVPVWTLIGDKDQFYDLANSYIDRINACNPKTKAIKTIYPGLGHSTEAWDRAYSADHAYQNPNIYEWMLQYSKGGATPVNQPPVANAGSNVTITLPTSSTTLNGSNSSDSDGAITKYEWTQTSGPNTAKLATPTTATSAVSGLVAGTYVFKLTVTDNNGATASASVTITVNAAASNPPPVANAGNNVTVNLPSSTATLNGSNSSNAASYSWKQVSGPNTSTIATPTAASTTVSNLIAGTYIYELTVTNTDKVAATARVTVTVNAASSTDCGCNITITPGSDGGAYIDGSKRDVKPGDVICIKAGKYKYIEFFNFSGTPEAPLTFINCGGQVQVGEGNYFGINMSNSKYWRFTGTGSADKYGFSVNTTGKYLASGFAAGKGCSDYEIDHIEIQHTEAGVLCKVNPDCDPMNQHPNFKIMNTKFHDLYIHDVTGEGMYIGHTSQNGVSLTCNGATVNALPPRLFNVQIYNVITNNTGWDGIQLSGAPENAYIYNNKVSNYGLENKGSQQAGIIFGGENVGAVYNNTIIKGTGNGIQIFGSDLVKVYNNIVVDAGYDGSAVRQDAILIDDRPTNVIYKPLRLQVFNNTIVRPGRKGINFMKTKGTVGTGNMLYNNFIVAVGADLSSGDRAYMDVSNGIDYTAGNNLFLADINAARFVDVAGNNFHITNLSPALDKGYNASAYGITKDIDGDNRPQGAAFDIGADEYNSTTPPTNKPPVANAGSNVTITLPVNTANLDGSASTDADGKIVTYTWKQLSGPSTSAIASPNAAKTAVNNLVAGTYVYELKVTDDDNATATAQVSVIVKPSTNKPPVANAGSNFAITLPTTTANLDGSASTDPDNNINTYSWTQVSGPNQANIATPNAVKTAIGGLIAGNYVFQLKVTDKEGLSSTAQVTLTVNAAPNRAPIADAGNDITITLPANSTTLNGSKSSDPDGSIVKFEWKLITGPSTVAFDSPNSATTNVKNLSAGAYIFELIVTDNLGATASDRVTVTVQSAPNKAPVAKAGNDITITLPTNSVTLDGSQSTDEDGSIVSYSWLQVSGTKVSITNPQASKATVSGLAAGVYEFELTVKDNGGATSTDRVLVTVLAANKPPVAVAGADVTITLPTNSVTVNGNASSDEDGTITKYAWTKISGGNATIASPNAAQTTISGLAEGKYEFELTVTDNNGATAKDRIIITVQPAPNKAPVANAGADFSVQLPGPPFTLDGKNSYDPDGNIVSYSWKLIAGEGATILSPNMASTGVLILREGDYSFELTVTDNKGAISKDVVTVKAVSILNVLEVLLYPNPATSRIRLDIKKNEIKSGMVYIMNSSGSMVKQYNIGNITNSYNLDIDVSNFAAGIYYIKLVGANGVNYTTNFVKVN